MSGIPVDVAVEDELSECVVLRLLESPLIFTMSVQLTGTVASAICGETSKAGTRLPKADRSSCLPILITRLARQALFGNG